jgi:hypothetical protein
MSSASLLTSLPAGDCLASNSGRQLELCLFSAAIQLNSNSAPLVLLIASRHELHRKHSLSVAVYRPLPSDRRYLVVLFLRNMEMPLRNLFKVHHNIVLSDFTVKFMESFPRQEFT